MGAASIVDRKFATFCNIACDIETYVNLAQFSKNQTF